jgi:hypothetical protein
VTETTSAQRSTSTRKTQRGRLLGKLRSRTGHWFPLPEILALGIAQYSARIFELRRLGYRIENKREGEHTFFRLLESSPSRREDVLDDYAVKLQVEAAVAKDGSHEAGFLFPAEPVTYSDPEEDCR